MIKNNVTPIHSQSLKPTGDITLENVQTALNIWRQNKTTRGEKIPTYLWDQIIHLLNKNPKFMSKTLAALGIGRSQLEAEKQRRQSIAPPVNTQPSSTIEELDFCGVNQKPEPTYPLAYKPAETFSTTTSVVELYRKDGALMKIHICTERFDELLRAFFNGCE